MSGASPMTRRALRTSLRAGAALLFVALSLSAATAAPQSAARGAPRRHADALARLDAQLAAGDSAAATELLRSLEPELAADDRFALDTIYVLVRHRSFDEAKARWNALAPRLQKALGATPARPSPAAEAERKSKVAEALFAQGLLMARGGDTQEALRLLRQADGYGFPPLDSPLMLLAGDCLEELKEHALAVQAYQEYLKHAPGDATARLRLAVALYGGGRRDAAQAELEALLRRAPDTPRASFYLAAVLFDKKRYPDAKARLEQELRLDPRCADCLAKLADIAYLEGDDRLCESWLAKALAVDSLHLEATLVSGMLALRAGRYEQAIQELLRVVERSPDYAKAQYQLGLAYQRAGNAEQAKRHFDIYTRLIQEEKARTIGVRGS